MTAVAPPAPTLPRSVADAGPLAMAVAGLSFQNPVVLASGTAGYGHELREVVDLERLGGIVTKAVSVEPRKGNPAPRVAEFPGGMINAVGLANPGLEVVRRDHLPRLAALVSRARVLVNVVGFAVDEFARVVEGLDDAPAVEGFELNVSCPNVKAGGAEFGSDQLALRTVVESCRRATRKPLVVKLSPVLPQVAETARIAVDSGADALTLTNTIPGLVVDVDGRRPALGFGSGGVSGAGLVPVGVLATWRVRQAVRVPIVGLGGVRSAHDALQYLLAGASLVGIGTAAMQDPRLPERVVRDLDRWRDRHGVARLADVVGTLQWPT
ncbi:dihydroorotate dehydrogenase [Roseisolibacter agri]|uniref:Dihydroorotate dehydrogenase n=1 Tax=Roseisolibacter agri TaxID=2014610 RepID=A0AA37QIN7_9BACT|nr:dihydroorotate dehydrogenase [Roseisolibacter agri]GLC27573.1 dihydroorotate dehydrogenase B (NAD(+)), catalytic subunit [Roseisolibacter agri]